MKKLTLCDRMGTPQERGIFRGYLFGEAYVKEGSLYVKRNLLSRETFFRLYDDHRLGYRPSDDLILELQAEDVGLAPLTTKELSLDLLCALEKAGISDGKLVRVIYAECKDYTKMVERQTQAIRFSPFAMFANMERRRSLSIIGIEIKKPKQSVFMVKIPPAGECEYNDLVISSKVKEVGGIAIGEIFDAYATNINAVSFSESSYERAYRKARAVPRPRK